MYYLGLALLGRRSLKRRIYTYKETMRDKGVPYNSLCDDLTHVKRWLYSSGISASIDVTGDLLAAEREPFRELLSRSVRCDSSYLLLGCKTLSRVDFNTPLTYYEPLWTRLYVGAAMFIRREMARLRGRESGE
jgi:hypothetical protein